MSVTLSVTLRGPKMEGTWWGEDDPKSSCEVQGKLLDAEQVRVTGCRDLRQKQNKKTPREAPLRRCA